MHIFLIATIQTEWCALRDVVRGNLACSKKAWWVVIHAREACLIECLVLAQIKYEIVSEEELETMRKQFQTGQLQIKIEEQTFSMKCAPYTFSSKYFPTKF